jgi:tetratricopeptide (TPR) repeat protein
MALHVAYPQIALAEVHLAAAQTDQALRAARQALSVSQQGRLALEEGAAYRVLGQIHEAMDDRSEADAAFRRSLEVLEGIQSRPEFGQTLLACGRFRQDDDAPEGRAMIERALALFEEMNATGWIEEARGVLGPEAKMRGSSARMT